MFLNKYILYDHVNAIDTTLEEVIRRQDNIVDYIDGLAVILFILLLLLVLVHCVRREEGLNIIIRKEITHCV